MGGKGPIKGYWEQTVASVTVRDWDYLFYQECVLTSDFAKGLVRESVSKEKMTLLLLQCRLTRKKVAVVFTVHAQRGGPLQDRVSSGIFYMDASLLSHLFNPLFTGVWVHGYLFYTWSYNPV